MKIFISHSSLDKWIARRLSQDLQALGASTFLDEKDIETGDSIGDSIQQHLVESDELLILLSPAALASHWVLLEIGGARALGKRLVPILLHVGPNELPHPLQKDLARDLNDVDKYYDEVRRRIAGAPEPRPRRTRRPPTSAASPRRRTFEVGDSVRIPSHPQQAFISSKGRVVWHDTMTAHAGKVAVVTEVDDDRTVKLDPGDDWWWAMDWLEPLTTSNQELGHTSPSPA